MITSVLGIILIIAFMCGCVALIVVTIREMIKHGFSWDNFIISVLFSVFVLFTISGLLGI